ncbi:MAG TPA: RHS repeat-associated core domain-containing protein [Bacteroidales bacterium]|nr:RHS repeat-associated core domain-containing protein [Bacteroidales bacterium]
MGFKKNRVIYYSYKFTGKERDEETGYDYFGARYYDSDLSQWLSVDPMSDKHPDLSPYNYCTWNPVRFIDPLGLDTGYTDKFSIVNGEKLPLFICPEIEVDAKRSNNNKEYKDPLSIEGHSYEAKTGPAGFLEKFLLRFMDQDMIRFLGSIFGAPEADPSNANTYDYNGPTPHYNNYNYKAENSKRSKKGKSDSIILIDTLKYIKTIRPNGDTYNEPNPNYGKKHKRERTSREEPDIKPF